MGKIKKILIANRGEIAVRIIRGIREMELSPVVVYSDADQLSLAVRLADEAYYIGESPSSKSYLIAEKVIEVAKRSGSDAIHPGYGFLAENADFARKVEESGLIFIGPSPEAIIKMGSKTLSRDIMRKAGVPVVPGTVDPLKDASELSSAVKDIGFPLLLKASAGGGGKGMRRVDKPEDLEEAFNRARSEALSSFGDDSVYVEKYIQEPHHVEIQILADNFGNTVYLGERECSVQRRYQKIIEETPSPFITDEVRKKMGEIAVKAAEAVKYKNAGTVEFIVDKDQNFYFLEMNTRLQVEHPITEMVTGIDLVKEQIRIASGEKLNFKQEDIKPRGSSLECRIYAEDPFNNFAPSPGKIIEYVPPAGGIGVRDDTGVYEGFEVPIFYDPLISKLVTWGRTREEAINRMKRALFEYRIAGIKTSIPYFLQILENKEFLSGNYTTNLIERIESKKVENPVEFENIALLASGIRTLENNGNNGNNKKEDQSDDCGWKTYGRMKTMRRF
ncbi:MAG: acetyl-CoA carboxylase biotin carboxylase subunit [Acidobacteriota bacterium]